MKTNKFLTLILSFVAVLAMTSCVEDDDFAVPSSLGAEENAALQALLNGPETLKTIEQVKALYVIEGEPALIVSDIYMKGYVTSSDASGNFFKEFYIQDSPSNPTAAIKIVLDQVDSYNQFNIGREVYVKLKGLYVGETRSGDGVIAIGGKLNDEIDEVEAMNDIQIRTSLLRSQLTEALIPLTVTLNAINGSNIGMYVIVENALFPENLSGAAYGDPTEAFDTQRTLQACEGFDYSEFRLETSSFANFKQENLPTGGGTIAGIVSKTYDGSNFVLALNTTTDVNMDGTRCTPLDINDFNTIFEEDFESMTANQAVTGNGWTNYAEAGTFSWRVRNNNDSGNGTQIASMGAYNSNSNSNIAWLISPSIDFDAQDNQYLSFETSNSFSDNSELELLISTDWDGTTSGVGTATWEALPGTIVDDAEFYQNWISSGSIDLSGYAGAGHVAFKYIGGDNSNNEDGTFEVDNFKVLGL